MLAICRSVNRRTDELYEALVAGDETRFYALIARAERRAARLAHQKKILEDRMYRAGRAGLRVETVAAAKETIVSPQRYYPLSQVVAESINAAHWPGYTAVTDTHNGRDVVRVAVVGLKIGIRIDCSYSVVLFDETRPKRHVLAIRGILLAAGLCVLHPYDLPREKNLFRKRAYEREAAAECATNRLYGQNLPPSPTRT